MNRAAEFSAELLAVMAEPVEAGDVDLLATFLGLKGYVYGGRSATNVRLLAGLFSSDILATICYMALSAPVPDMALNNLERLCGIVPRDQLLLVASNRVSLRQLLVICGSSPFLTNIISRDPDLVHDLFIGRKINLRRSEADMLAALRSTVAGAGYADIFPLLRRFKHAEVLRIAARDLNGLAPLEEVTEELSSLAAASLQVAYESSRWYLAAEHGIPLMRTPTGLREAELTILGMGKFGGRELNFSSDIDLIFVHASDQGETTGVGDGTGGLKGRIPIHTFFVKQAELIARAISQVTGDGFVFRVDMGLRPEGKSGEMSISLRSAEVYYESWGQSWERAAMLKARPVAGALQLGEQLLRSIEPFVYRKYLDYNLIEDMMAMKKKIDASLVREREGEYNIKLGRGGIREIEFFIQALQLVYAGKNPALRERNSLKSLKKLAEARIITEEDGNALSEAYRFLRTVEHRIQVVQERQTHALPRKDDEMLALARRTGYLRTNGCERFRAELEAQRSSVSKIYGGLFLARDERLRSDVRPETYIFFDQAADPELIKDMLAEQRFEDPDAAYEHLLTLRDGPPRAHFTERSQRILTKIGPLLLQEIFGSPDPDMALAHLDRFLCTVSSRTPFFSLLAENREIAKVLVSLFGMSEFLSKIFIGHPELLDSMVGRGYAAYYKSKETMVSDLAALLERADDFEEQLDVLRRYRHEEFLRIGMNDIYGKVRQTEIAAQLTSLAEVCLDAAYRLSREQLDRYGRPTWKDGDGKLHEAEMAIVGMGKLGGGELNYHSDLDIIYIYDHKGFTDGEKQVTNHEYFAKLGQKIISILTTQTREGYVYKLDTRLRPSGNAGPLVTSLESFAAYHRDEAQIWERQALTKARVVVGGDELRRGCEKIIRHTVYDFSTDEAARAEIHRLRMRMENELAKESAGIYNIKTGRGGMVDVEFIVQYLQLKYGRNMPEVRVVNTLEALTALGEAGILAEDEVADLSNGYRFLRRLENRLRIIHDYSMNGLGGTRDYLDKLARRLGYDTKLRHPGDDMMRDYEEVTAKVRKVYDRVLGGA